MDISEFELIRRIVEQIPKKLREEAQLKDDTAVIKPVRAYRQLLTTDAIVENIDFRLRDARAEEIGQKALAVNLSDIAAMGGAPEYFTVALGIPRYINARWIKRFYSGLLRWARHFNVVCAGGDISQAPIFFASVTVSGRSRQKPILRSGARIGDWIGVTGTLGGSLSGHHLNFKPRVEEGRFLADNSVHAMIDVSDGFLQDMNHLLTESRAGCVIETSVIPISAAAFKKYGRGKPDRALSAALTDGEDFELIFTADSACRKRIDSAWNYKFPKTRLTWIGRIQSPAIKWGWLKQGQPCKPINLTRKGYQHFE